MEDRANGSANGLLPGDNVGHVGPDTATLACAKWGNVGCHGRKE